MNSIQSYEVPDLLLWRSVAEKLMIQAEKTKLWCIRGALGAGKTTLIRFLAHELESIDQVKSPTFALVNTYLTAVDTHVYHIDLYRLKGKDDFQNLDLETYLSGKNYCFIEWPEKIIPYLRSSYFLVHITTKGEGRKVEASHVIQ